MWEVASVFYKELKYVGNGLETSEMAKVFGK